MVDSDGQDIDTKGVFFRWGESKLSRAAEDHGPNIHGSTCLVWGHICRIQPYGETYGVHEKILRDLRDADELGRMGQADGILGGSKDGNLAIWLAECLEAFIGLLSIVEARREAVNVKVGRGDKFWRGPLLGLDAEVTFNMAVHWGTVSRGISEGRVVQPSRTRKPMSFQSIQVLANVYCRYHNRRAH